MSQDSKRRLCKFTPVWCSFKDFSSWLVPVKYQTQKAYCVLCKRVFSVSHSGLHDVKAHCRGKKHLQLQGRAMEKSADERLDRREIKACTLIYNEEINSLEENDETNYDLGIGKIHFASGKKSIGAINNCFERKVKTGNLLDDGVPEENDFLIRTSTIRFDGDPINKMNSKEKESKNMSLQIKSQVSSQQYCLRWKYHHSNLQVMFIQLLQRESFCDVTLACEGKMLRAHKVVLSACSTYFDKIFSEHEEKDPVVILKDVKFVDIKALVEFMYKGEINVENSHLNSLLKTAEELKIKGLADVSGKTIPKEEDEDDSVTYGPSSVTVQSGKEESVREIKTEQIGDYDDMFTPTIVDGAPSVNDGSDNEDENMDKKGEEMDEVNDYMDSASDQNFSTLIAQLSDHPLQDYQSEEANERNSEQENAENALNLALQFPDVIKMNDYLTTGRRQQFWEEPFTRRLMEAIKNKEIEMKAAAELMGVSYGTLYGRYRDAYGCLKHPYRTKEFWAEQGPADILAKLQNKEITLFRAAEMLNVTVTTLANYLTTLRCDKDREKDSDDEVEDMDVNDSMDAFEANSAPSNVQLKSKMDSRVSNDEEDDSRSSNTGLDRSDEDFP